MTERYDEIERHVGIVAYASPESRGFAAVLKARYSDFIVHEVDRDGNAACLDSSDDLLVPDEGMGDDPASKTRQEQQSRKRKADEADEGNNAKRCKGGSNGSAPPSDQPVYSERKSISTTAEKLHDAQTQLSELVGKDAAERAIGLIKHWEMEQPAADEPKYFTLPEIKQKEKRKAIHMLVRSELMAPFARADTAESRVRVWHRKFESDMPGYGSFAEDRRRGRGGGATDCGGDKKAWPKDRPDYLRFVLYKENIDTGTAAKDIIRFARINPRNKGGVGYAGMKDKRGVTSQFVTLYRKEPKDLLVLNRHNASATGGGNTNQRGASLIRVGKFSFVNREIRLGMLNGNRFDIALRNVDVGVSAEIPSLPDEERIAVSKELLEKAALSMKQNGFINYFGMQRFGKFVDTHKVGTAVLKGDFEVACDIIMRPKPDENPKMASARRRWQDRFQSDSELDEQGKSEAEMKCAKSVLKDLGRFMTCEVALMNSLSRKPRDCKKAFRAIPKNLRLMFLHSVQSYLWNHMASYRIKKGGLKVMLGDLVWVGGKKNVHGESDAFGRKGKLVRAVNEDDLLGAKYGIADVVLPLVGAKVQYPLNCATEKMDEVLQEMGLTRQSFFAVQDKDLALGGDYRALVCKPSDFDYEIKLYREPLQPLMQTDLMKVHGVDVGQKCVAVDATNTKGPPDVRNEPEKQADHADGKSMQKPSLPTLIGLIVGFTLPSSSYATIALRDLMKRPTSSDYQSMLALEGRCEKMLSTSLSDSGFKN